MKFQIIVTPCAALPVHTDTPFGALYIASSLRQEGHEVRIENCDTEKLDYAELSKRIKQYNPDVIGISGVIVMAYKYIRDTTLFIKREFPNIKIIVGGGVSVVAELLLNNSGADIVGIGEGDITIKELAQRINQGRPYYDVAGIAFREANTIVKTQPRLPIMDLDILEYPEFDLIDMSKYLLELEDSILSYRYYKKPDKRLFQPHRSKRMLRILLSRGCVSRCTFCYRPTAGHRHFSFRYIFDYIEYLMGKFNINIFSFGDECFSSTKAWNWRFLEELKKRKLDILFQIMGMRVDTIDYDMLRAFKEAGCFQIFYGFESGSQRMLDIIDKKITVEQNLWAAQWTRQAGIYTSPNFLFGMPGETTETVGESIDFLKKLNFGPRWHQYVYAIAVPGTPLYDYAKVAGLILDEDKYLESLYYTNSQELINTNAFINFTTEKFETVKNWPHFLRDELMKHYSKNKVAYFIKKYLRLNDLCYSLKKSGFKRTLKKIMKYILKRKKKLEYKYCPVMQESSLGRDRYVERVNRFIGENKKRYSLRQVTKQIKDDH